MERELPIYKIEGTEFVVDVHQSQLREKANPENVISFFEIRDLDNGYEFEYCLSDKNLPSLFNNHETLLIRIPEMVELDPIGMAEKYGFKAGELKGKTDFEVMVDQKALEERLNGKLVSVEIQGHTFYVDIPMDMLRPKDDFISNGIVFSQIDHYFLEDKNVYSIPYNPETHEFQELQYDNILEIPKDLIVIEFPHEMVLDPVGFNRRCGLKETDNLKEVNIRSHYSAVMVDWKDTGIQQIIDTNRKKLNVLGNRRRQSESNKKTGKRKGRGKHL